MMTKMTYPIAWITVVAAVGIGTCHAAEVLPKGWRVAPLNSAPGLYKDGKPVAPMFF